MGLLFLPQAYDSHCNIVLGEVEETIYMVDDEDEQESVRVRMDSPSAVTEMHADTRRRR